MEPFFDGGLFEVLLALAMASILNGIFRKKYLLSVYSVITITASALLFVIKPGELFIWLAVISMFNSILLLVLVWIKKINEPHAPLINVERVQLHFLKRKA